MSGRGPASGAAVLHSATASWVVLKCTSGFLSALESRPRPPAPRRYSIQLIGAASLVAQKRKAAAVDVEDVSKAYTLFLDVQRSVQYLQVGAGRCPACCDVHAVLFLDVRRSVQYLQVGAGCCAVHAVHAVLFLDVRRSAQLGAVVACAVLCVLGVPLCHAVVDAAGATPHAGHAQRCSACSVLLLPRPCCACVRYD